MRHCGVRNALSFQVVRFILANSHCARLLVGLSPFRIRPGLLGLIQADALLLYACLALLVGFELEIGCGERPHILRIIGLMSSAHAFQGSAALRAADCTILRQRLRKLTRMVLRGHHLPMILLPLLINCLLRVIQRRVVIKLATILAVSVSSAALLPTLYFCIFRHSVVDIVLLWRLFYLVT